MRRVFFKYIVCTMFILLSMTSCRQFNMEDATHYTRTVMVYMAADNNLSYSTSSFARQDLDEMIGAAGDIPSNCRLIVYIDDTKLPRILSITQQEGRRPMAKVVHEYDTEHNSADADTLRSFVEWTTDNYPSKSYGLVLWSHGDAWMPSKSPAQRAVCLDSEASSWMEIDELADALEKCHQMDFILFDACFMQCIEVAYELRHTARYIIGSPAEIPAPGAPYHRIVKAMFTPSNNAQEIVEQYYQEYSEEKITIPGYYDESYGVCLSAIDCQQLHSLAEATRAMLSKYINTQSEIDLKDVQRYYLYTTDSHPYMYDMNGYMRVLLTDEKDYRYWASTFDDAVPYRRSTTHWYSDYTGKEMVDMENYGGVSCYVPRNNPNRTKLNEAFRNTSWHDAAGWEVWYGH